MDTFFVNKNIVLNKSKITMDKNSTSNFTVKLENAPNSEQIVKINTDNPFVTVSPSILTFTPNNYSTEQIVTVTTLRNANQGDTITITCKSEYLQEKLQVEVIRDSDGIITSDDFCVINANGNDLTFVNNVLSLSSNPTKEFGSIYLKNLEGFNKITASFPSLKNIWITYNEDDNYLYSRVIYPNDTRGTIQKFNKITGSVENSGSSISTDLTIQANEILTFEIQNKAMTIKKDNGTILFTIDNVNVFGFMVAGTTNLNPICENLTFSNK